MKKLLRMIGVLAVLGAMVLSASCSLWGDPQAYTQALVVDPVEASGASIVRIHVGAGTLSVRGVPGLNEVRIQAISWASSLHLLEKVRLTAVRNGADIQVTSVASLEFLFGQAGIDLIIEVPTSLAVEVEDGSGAVEVDNVLSVALTDGSDDINIDGVSGNVLIGADGSGDISVMNVGGSVIVNTDGSGDIHVQNILGDFVVRADGSGIITYDEVQGDVKLP